MNSTRVSTKDRANAPTTDGATVGRHGIARRAVLAASLGAALAAAGSARGQAAAPLRVLVGASPGGVTDTLARLVSMPMGVALNQPVTVENLPGASGSLAAGALMKSRPDGNTVIVTSAVIVQLPQMSKAPYDPFRDFAPVAQIGGSDLLLVVRTEGPAKTLAEFIERARRHPDGIAYGTPGQGTVYHLAAELLARRAGIRMVPVPYKGGAQFLADLIGGHLDIAFADTTVARPLIDGGKLRALAVAARQRSRFLPQVPTFAELGHPDVVAGSLSWMLAPARTPALVLERLSAEVVRAVEQPSVRARMLELGFEPQPGSPAQLSAAMRAEHAKWAEVIAHAKIRLE